MTRAVYVKCLEMYSPQRVSHVNSELEAVFTGSLGFTASGVLQEPSHFREHPGASECNELAGQIVEIHCHSECTVEGMPAAWTHSPAPDSGSTESPGPTVTSQMQIGMLAISFTFRGGPSSKPVKTSPHWASLNLNAT